MAASSSSSSGGSFKYDVFINFRGEDTRSSFVCHLYHALNQTLLDTFIDSEELQKGDDLSKLYKAIQDSRLSILVFSKHYATSTWCLKELVQILECMDRQNQIVVPVFYQVDPSHVRKLKESFAEAFAKHESDSNVNKEELESWKSSLTRAANLSGYHSKDYRDDIQLIKSIVEDILKKVIRISPSCKTDDLIGMDTHMNKIDSLFKSGVDDCRNVVGIWGMGGIGKSTIARAVYEKYSPQFEHKCFLDNVKEDITKKGARQMVEDLLSRILKIKDRSTLDGGLNMMRERLGEKKILLVLDDVDAMEQIDTLIGEDPSFGGGSRIIITTRDKNLLARFLVYEPQLFTPEKALELFRRYAFRTIKFSESHDAISRRAVEYAHRLPLALKVLGGLLDNKKVEEWEYELEKIKKIPLDNKIGRVLVASYNGLDECQKNIFLDIACFFRGKFEYDWGFVPKNEIRVLEERSLVTVSESGYRCLEMHDLIQEMGREIVRQESPEDPGRRSRLWYYEDVLQVLAQNTPAEAVEGIILDLSKLKELWVNYEVFVGMKRLKLLQLTNNWFPISTCKQHVSGDLKSLSNELRVLVWHGCPLKSLPSDFQPKNLIKIDMPRSRIEQLWEGTKPLPDLVDMDLSASTDLIKTPDLAEATNLVYLNLEGCTSLLGVHPSISALESLFDLNLSGCRELRSLPSSIHMKSLETLDLSGCSKLEEFPEISEVMERLDMLDLDGTAVKELPSSINNLTGLVSLRMRNCTSLVSLPSSIHMKSLRYLYLSGCSKLEEFPEISEVMETLYELDLDGTAVKELPSSINNLTGLVSLSMRNCTSLVSLPSSIHMKSLRYLYLSGCSKLEEFPEISEVMERLDMLDLDGTAVKELPSSINNLTGLRYLSMRNCTSLVSIPDEICDLACLGTLDLTGCSKLSKLPDNFQNWESLGKRTSWRSYSLDNLDNLEGSGIKQLPFCISQKESLFCTGLKELTAPFSSWPTCTRNPSSSILVYLDLSDCNVLELSDAIAHLSSLRKLDLSGNNNLESLPEAMNRLGHLKKLYLRGCKGLKSIPELCSSIQRIDANNCTSLETVSAPQLPCVGSIHFTFFNCLKLAKTNLFMFIAETAATDNQGEDSGSDFDSDSDSDPDAAFDFKPLHRMSLPGSDIPDWFNHQDRGSSVTVQLPPDWSPDMSELAICAISNLRGARSRKTLESAFCCATFKANEGQDNFDFRLLPQYQGETDVPLESDHMILRYINLSNFGTLHSGRKYTHFTFRIVTWDFMSLTVDSSITWHCTWITSCGVRLFQMNVPSSVDLVCNVENRETEISSKRKRETLERGKEKMGIEVQEEEEECSGGPICTCPSLSGCTISLRKKQRETDREAEGVAGLESEEADVSGEGGLLTLSL